MAYIALLVFLMIGCSETELTQPYTLNSLRILAIVADTPEVNDNGATVTLTPIVSDFNGEGRVLSVDAYGCTSPNISGGADPSCDEADDRVSLTSATYDPSSATSGLQGDDYTGAIDSFIATIPSDFLEGQSVLTQTNGRDYLIEVIVTSGEDENRAIKRIKVSSQTDLNTNPEFLTIEYEGEDWDDLSSYPDEGSLIANATDASAEDYTYLATSGETVSLTEELTLQVFTTRGDWERSYSATDAEIAFTPSSTSDNATFVLILTDGRGGVDVEFRRF